MFSYTLGEGMDEIVFLSFYESGYIAKNCYQIHCNQILVGFRPNTNTQNSLFIPLWNGDLMNPDLENIKNTKFFSGKWRRVTLS